METCRNLLRRCLAASLAAAMVICISACGESPEPLTEADFFYTRSDVELYSGLEPDSPATATLPFGTRVRIHETYRSFVKIETPTQLLGWVPRSLLLDYYMRQHLETLTAASATLPNQGLARARDTLNVHVQPYRWSPTFHQLDKDEGFHIIDRMLVDRLPAIAATAPEPPEPTGEDYWYLVRVPGIEQAGWLLGNMVYSDIPLDVAMLAMGQSIVAYFPLGESQSEVRGTTKTTWLWVQSTKREQTHDFDRLSVFRWDARRDRYLIIRQISGLKGYLPIEVIPDFTTPRGTGTGFRILFERNGELRASTHVFANRRVYKIVEEPVPTPPPLAPPGGFGSRYEFTRLPTSST